MNLSIVAFITISVALILIFRSHLRRRDMMANLRQELDMESTSFYNASIEGCLRASKLGYPEWTIRFENMMTCEHLGNRIALFDLRSIVGSKHGDTSTERQSITMLLPPISHLPTFQIQPEGLLAKVSIAFGFQDINFDDHPEFSERYRLMGDHERMIREFFTKPVLDLLASNTGWWIDSNRRGLIVYKKNHMLSRKQIIESMDLAVELAALLGTRGKGLLAKDRFETKGLSCMTWLPIGSKNPVHDSHFAKTQ